MYNPKWEGPIEGFSRNFARLQLYKLQPIGFEFDDIVQEAYIVFDKCKTTYPDLDTAKHFMSLYKIALRRRLFDIWYPKRNEQFLLTELDNFVEEFKDVEREGFFRVLLSEAPKEIKEVLSLLFRAPDEVLELLGLSQKRKGRSIESSNRKLCALFGYDYRKVNVISLIKTYFTV